MEMGKVTQTYSGAPQGGTASPVLANVVLHELDGWMETRIGANPPAQTPKQLTERRHPEYSRLSYRIGDLRRYLDGKRPLPKANSEAELRDELVRLPVMGRCVLHQDALLSLRSRHNEGEFGSLTGHEIADLEAQGRVRLQG